ncbi:hypothetical protein TIFTF001_002863 [Ficus carica]|uniref:Gamma-glutamylcyclotransferase family protein n=1 Tax=Ficus carica TaxID=3494 RepID=A0AA87ZDL3_FICCA|nr:hypothetical protein TIFTF001_002863 [Ficus carica]
MDETSEHVPNNETKQKLIFIYGRLKRGLSNHWQMADLISRSHAAFLGTCVTVQPYPIVRDGTPYLINLPGRGRRVHGELYSVTADRGLNRLDYLVGIGVGQHERLPICLVSDTRIDLTEVSAEAYFAQRSFGPALWERSGKVYGDKSDNGAEAGEASRGLVGLPMLFCLLWLSSSRRNELNSAVGGVVVVLLILVSSGCWSG